MELDTLPPAKAGAEETMTAPPRDRRNRRWGTLKEKDPEALYAKIPARTKRILEALQRRHEGEEISLSAVIEELAAPHAGLVNEGPLPPRRKIRTPQADS